MLDYFLPPVFFPFNHWIMPIFFFCVKYYQLELWWSLLLNVVYFLFNSLQAEGGALSFVKPNQSFLQENAAYGKPPQTLLAYVNGDHEYVVFDPYSDETSEVTGMHQGAPVDHGETGGFCNVVFFIRLCYVVNLLHYFRKLMNSFGKWKRPVEVNHILS